MKTDKIPPEAAEEWAIALIERAAAAPWRNPTLTEYATAAREWAAGPRQELPPQLPVGYPCPAGLLTAAGTLAQVLHTATRTLPSSAWDPVVATRRPMPAWVIRDMEHYLDCAIEWGSAA